MWMLEPVGVGVQRAPVTRQEETHGAVPTPVRRCVGCDAPITAPGPKTGAQRKWCSDNCRKRTWDKSHPTACVDCGVAVPRSGGTLHERCRDCWKTWVSRGKEERIRDVAEMYNDGLSLKEIAAELGYGPTSTPPAVVWARQRGLIGYRYKACEERNVSA